MSNSVKIILSIGSNVNQMENVLYAKSLLKCLLDNIHFTEMIWTEPIGIVSDKYVNCMAEAMTAMHLDKRQFELKKIEQNPADKVEPKFHEGDWTVSKLDKKARQISEVHFDEYNSY